MEKNVIIYKFDISFNNSVLNHIIFIKIVIVQDKLVAIRLCGFDVIGIGRIGMVNIYRRVA